MPSARPLTLGPLAPLAVALALGGWACDGAAPVTPTPIQDQAVAPDGGPTDARVGADATPDLAVADAALPDGGPADGGDLDLGDGTVGDGGLDGGLDLALPEDAALPDPPGRPSAPTIGGATVDGVTWLAWASGGTVRWGQLDGDGALRHDPDLDVLDILPLPIARVAVVAAGEVPWAVWSVSDGPVRARALDADAPPLDLGLRGPALAAPLGSGARTDLLVVGRDDAGNLAWQTVREADTQASLTPARVSDIALPLPDDLAPIDGAVVLRFAGLGRCLPVDSELQLGASFFCKVGPGRIISNGQRPLLVSHEPFGRRDRFVVGFLFGAGGGHTYDLPIVPEGLSAEYATVDGQYALVGEDEIGAAQGEKRLVVSAIDALWRATESAPTWTHPDARLVVPRGPVSHLIEFDAQGSPSVVSLAMEAQAFDTPYGLTIDPRCLPQPETCDGTDEDCDGRIDNGLCCANGQNRREFSVRRYLGPGLGSQGFVPDQVLLTGVRTQDQLWVAVRYTTEDGPAWTGRTIGTGNRNANAAIGRLRRFGDPDTQGLPPWPMVADRGLALAAARDYALLLATGPDGHTWANWSHPDLAPLTGVPKPPVDLDATVDDPALLAQGWGPCGDLDDDGVVDPAPEGAPDTWPVLSVVLADETEDDTSVLVVCPRRFLRLYPAEGRADVVLPFPQRAPARWAQTVRDNDGRVTVLYAFVDSVGAWALDAFEFDAVSDTFDRVPLPLGLLGRGAEGAASGPIRSSPTLGGPFVHYDPRGGFARVLTEPDDRFGWRALTGATLNGWTLARRTFNDVSGLRVQPLLLGTAADDAETALWVVDVETIDGLRLWLDDQPTLTLAAPHLWAPVDAPGYGFPVLSLAPRADDTLDWWASLPYISCR